VTVMQLAVILIGLLCLLNAVAVVALIRQVGVLHLRIRPVAGLAGAEGPEYGSELTLPTALSELAPKDATRFLIGFISPTCGLCGPLTSSFGQLAKSADSETAVVLVIDAGARDAEEYLRSKGVGFLPYIAHGASFAANGVPGAPWAVITDSSGTVIVSGGVNTLDNVEEMLVQADQLIANPPVSVLAPEASYHQPAEGH
jgi:hypothetical protein